LLIKCDELLNNTDPHDSDTDNDKMPDGWEVDNNLAPLDDDSGIDKDLDGFTNIREYIAGTDPTDENDIPYFTVEIENFETGNLLVYPWLTIGSNHWMVSNINPFLGEYSVESKIIDNNQNTSLEINLYCENGEVSFEYSVDSEENSDFLYFYIDGILQDSWSGFVDYTHASYTVTTGMHNFRWTYEKDHAASSGADRAWIDEISFPGSVDSDSDGMADGWEVENDLNYFVDDSMDDPDFDLFLI